MEDVRSSSNKDDLAFVAVLEKYADSRDPADAVLGPVSMYCWHLQGLGSWVAKALAEDDEARILAEIALLNLEGVGAAHPFVDYFMRHAVTVAHEATVEPPIVVRLGRELGIPESVLAEAMALYGAGTAKFGWTNRSLGKAEMPAHLKDALSGMDFQFEVMEDVGPAGIDGWSPLERYFHDLDDETLGRVLLARRKSLHGEQEPSTEMLGAFAVLRPKAFQRWIGAALDGERGKVVEWAKILRATDRWDGDFLKAIRKLNASEQLLALMEHAGAGREPRIDLLREAALHPEQEEYNHALVLLADGSPDEFLPRFVGWLDDGSLLDDCTHGAICRVAFAKAGAVWGSGGRQLFERLLELPFREISDKPDAYERYGHLCVEAMDGLLEKDPGVAREELEDWLRRLVQALESGTDGPNQRKAVMDQFWSHAAVNAKGFLLDEFLDLLGSRTKGQRELAIKGLREHPREVVVEKAVGLLSARKIDARLGAAEILAALADPSCGPALETAFESEASGKVLAALRKAMEACGAVPDAESRSLTLDELHALFGKQAKKLKMPKGDWLDLGALPALPTSSGEPLSGPGLTFLIAKQAKHKVIEPAPDVVPVLGHFDRAATTDFALALFDQWLASPQVAADRWVLVLVGVLADKRGISVLKAPIQSWADNSRHKLAEWAAQAIALIPGDEALTILDGLANRYRSKYKNIGRACREALETAAAARGVSLDDLADLIVPDFGFDADRQRTFSWDGGELIAVMGPDFKFSWINPATEKETKAMPAKTPDEVKTEVKALNKLLRESIKGQTARLELCLVRQRRWTVARWQELFEANPLFQSFAARLVWGVYDDQGVLQATFRRYPNGILADAAGEMVELEEMTGFVGIIHPLDLDDDAIVAWREHLGRMKVKPPFPQLDRPVARLDPQHGNRKEIGVANKVSLSFGTFRSRAEKRGWQRGSIVDGGGISSYCKVFPGAGVEVYLATEDIYIGFDPMDAMTLGVAYFAKAGSVEVGSYTYDEPSNGDDPRVLSFGDVPPVVYSETISDLEAIVEGQQS